MKIFKNLKQPNNMAKKLKDRKTRQKEIIKQIVTPISPLPTALIIFSPSAVTIVPRRSYLL